MALKGTNNGTSTVRTTSANKANGTPGSSPIVVTVGTPSTGSTTSTVQDPQTDKAFRTGDPRGLALQVLPPAGALKAEQAFSTGSRGYRYNGKAVDVDGVRYQCTVMLVRIGTKGN